MQTEFDVLVNNEIGELIPRNSYGNIINCIWLYEVKEKSNVMRVDDWR